MTDYKKGIFYAIGAYLMWGMIPLYWKQIDTVSSIEILVSRVIWSFLLTAFFILIIGQRKALLADIRYLWANQKQFWSLFVASIIISINWGVYIWAVNNDQLIQASLGYYINPLISVVFGLIFFQEKLSMATIVSVSIAGFAVCVMAFSGGTFPWISLTLAISFAFYGVLKKKIQLDATRGLAIETLYIVPLAMGVYLYLMNSTEVAFMHVDWKTNLFLIGSGVVTALPLILFAKGAQKIPLYLMGFIQFLSPTISLILGVVVFKEPFTAIESFTFGCIWLSVLIFSLSKFVEARKRYVRV